MTALQFYEAVLTELNKVKAPTLLLKDYVYFINKAINQYINKIYNNYEINQQKTDDLRTIKSSCKLTPVLNNSIYEVILPDDYLHILNCLFEYKVLTKFKCYSQNDYIQFGAKKLKSDSKYQILNNYYLKPKYDNPYFYINNFNIRNSFPVIDSQKLLTYNKYYLTIDQPDQNTNLEIIINNTVYTLNLELYYLNEENLIQDIINLIPEFTTENIYFIQNKGYCIDFLNITSCIVSDGSTIIIEKTLIPNNKESNIRYGNSYNTRMELYFGKNSKIELSNVYLDYLKTPKYFNLTEDEIDDIEDNSQVLEFQDYVINEIINVAIDLILENNENQRIKTHSPISTSIAP